MITKIFPVLWCAVWLVGCSSKVVHPYTQMIGETMGTYYQITYQPHKTLVTQDQIEDRLIRLNQALSTYDSTSVISQFNRAKHGINQSEINDSELASYFYDNLLLSQQIFNSSAGSFDPTVMPLVNYWGFGYTPRDLTEVDSSHIDSIQAYVGFDKLVVTINNQEWKLEKSNPHTELDYSAIAKGYAIDVLSQFLVDSFSVRNFLVDIGGESRALGVNRKGELWRVAINRPVEESVMSMFDFVVKLKNRSIATSGNYRNYYEIDGEKISHTINPRSGFYERNDLLSASIITDECAVADACATACMAMGFEAAKAFIARNKNLSAVLLYLDDAQKIKHYLTPDLRELENGLIVEHGI